LGPREWPHARSKSTNRSVLKLEGITKSYPTPRGEIEILNGISLTLERGEAVAVMGPSGSGKSTLLYVCGALEPPTSGLATVDGRNPFQLPERQLAAFRNKEVGFVFQDHCLLPQCTVLENVLVPTLVAEPGDHVQRARKLLERVGLGERLEHKPSELSGGEKQRVAIARALIREPLLLLCDEPTGNLDQASAGGVAELLLEVHRERRTILVVVTHSIELASKFPRRFQLTGGRLSEPELS
jgi:lipoprotein-releasing system ATP-binding protein